MVEKDLDLIHKIYGYKKEELSSVTQINIQSYFSIEDSFPELINSPLFKKNQGDLASDHFSKISAERFDKINHGHMVVYKNMDNLPDYHIKLLKTESS